MQAEHSFLLKSILPHFGISNVGHVTRIDKGWSNQNYRVRNKEGSYILKVINDFESDRFQNEILFHFALKQAGISSIVMLQYAEDSYLYDKEGSFATVSHEIQGSHPLRPSSLLDCYRVGEVLGDMHAKLDPNLNLGGDYLFTRPTRIEENLEGVGRSDLLKRVIPLFIEGSSLFRESRLPRGVLHGDLHADNILIDNEGNVSILDLESAGIGPFLVDVGRSIVDLCSINGSIDIARTKEFIRGYNTKRTMTETECQLFPLALMYGASCVALWACQNQVDDLAENFLDIAEDALTYRRDHTLFFA